MYIVAQKTHKHGVLTEFLEQEILYNFFRFIFYLNLFARTMISISTKSTRIKLATLAEMGQRFHPPAYK